VYFEKTYLLGLEKGSEKSYPPTRPRDAVTKRGAIAKLVMRGKEKLVLIRPTEEDRLLLEVLYYADEVQSPDEIAVGDVALSDTEVQLAQQVIDRVQPTTGIPISITIRIARDCWSLSDRNAKVSLFRRKNACRVRR